MLNFTICGETTKEEFNHILNYVFALILIIAISISITLNPLLLLYLFTKRKLSLTTALLRTTVILDLIYNLHSVLIVYDLLRSELVKDWVDPCNFQFIRGMLQKCVLINPQLVLFMILAIGRYIAIRFPIFSRARAAFVRNVLIIVELSDIILMDVLVVIKFLPFKMVQWHSLSQVIVMVQEDDEDKVKNYGMIFIKHCLCKQHES